MAAAGFRPSVVLGIAGTAAEGQLADEQEFRAAVAAYSVALAEWDEQRSIACRILGGDLAAFTQAWIELNPFDDMSDVCASVRLSVHSARLAECSITVKGTQILPKEMKSLTATGKVSIKPMPKARFHEIFQDYVCGCVLRVAREVFGILPVEVVLVTALVDTVDAAAGATPSRAVLSVAMPRAALNALAWERIDASDAIDQFTHRGDVKASRKTGEFIAILPLAVNEVVQASIESSSLAELLSQVRRLREELGKQSGELAAVVQSIPRI